MQDQNNLVLILLQVTQSIHATVSNIVFNLIELLSSVTRSVSQFAPAPSFGGFDVGFGTILLVVRLLFMVGSSHRQALYAFSDVQSKR